MTQNLSPQALKAQSDARESDGKFGTQLHAAPDVTLDAAPGPTSPKVDSKGRTVFVTLPDGMVVKRTSKTRHYTHAIVASPEDPERVKESALQCIETYRKNIEALTAALDAPKLRLRKKLISRQGDPDVNYKGEPSYNGFDYSAYAEDGKTVLATVRGNSKQLTRGGRGADGAWDPDLLLSISTALRSNMASKREDWEKWTRENQEKVEAVDNGTYDCGAYSVYGFSATKENARKTANGYGGPFQTRTFTVMEVDK